MANKSIKISVGGITKDYEIEELGTSGGGVSSDDITDAVDNYFEKNPIEELVDNTFYAVYGTTTNTEIDEAYQAGKKVYCLKGGAICPLYERYSPTMHCFYRGGFYIYCNADVWMEDCPYDVSTNKVTEITENSTDEQYPSAKAVFDILNSQKKNAVYVLQEGESLEDVPEGYALVYDPYAEKEKDYYTKEEINTMLGSYVNDIANLIGGDAIADS